MKPRQLAEKMRREMLKTAERVWKEESPKLDHEWKDAKALVWEHIKDSFAR